MAGAPGPEAAAYTLDRYGFEVDPEVLLPSEKDVRSRLRRENGRSAKWHAMMTEWQRFTEGDKQVKLKARVRKGVPDGVRAHVWQVSCGSMRMRLEQPNLYGVLRGRASPMDGQIEKDLHRTMPSHVQFHGAADGQRQLFNVCHALAVYDPRVGYNQAEAYVAAALLTYMTEEETFWTLLHISVGRGQGALWGPSFEGWQDYASRLDALVHAQLPRLHAHLIGHGVVPDLYALQWFLTLFAKDFPFETMLRIWDIFLCEPYPKCLKILFRVTLAILKEGEKELLKMNDVQQLTDYIRKLPFTNSGLQGDSLIGKALKISLKTQTLTAAAPGGTFPAEGQKLGTQPAQGTKVSAFRLGTRRR